MSPLLLSNVMTASLTDSPFEATSIFIPPVPKIYCGRCSTVNFFGALTNNSIQNGVFKVPFVRNIAMTAPYMHDGRFETLEEVIEHYSSGIKAHSNLSPQIPVEGFNFTETEKEDLVAFLHTLSDHEMATEERYSNPFK